MKLVPQFCKARQNVRIGLALKNRLCAVACAAVGISAVSTGRLPADTQSVFSPAATDLSVGANYLPIINPAAAPMVDVQLVGPYVGGTTLTVAGSALTFGTLNNLNATQPLTITNTAGAGSITLISAANGTVGANAADLIYVAAGANLAITNGTGSP